MTTALQYILSGLAIGGIYALVALGFHIMWSAAKAVNFAHGDTLMIGAVLAVMGVDAGLPLPLACLLAILGGALFGVVLERFAVRPFIGANASIGWMLTTIAVGIMAESLATMQFGGFSRPLPSPGVARAISIFGAGVYPQELVIPAVAVLAMIALHVMQRHTLVGRAMQAVAHNRQAAALMGIDVDRIVMFSFGLAALLGAGAGVLVAPSSRPRPAWESCSGSRASRSRSSAASPADPASCWLGSPSASWRSSSRATSRRRRARSSDSAR